MNLQNRRPCNALSVEERIKHLESDMCNISPIVGTIKRKLTTFETDYGERLTILENTQKDNKALIDAFDDRFHEILDKQQILYIRVDDLEQQLGIRNQNILNDRDILIDAIFYFLGPLKYARFRRK
jgi:hypothetical protein